MNDATGCFVSQETSIREAVAVIDREAMQVALVVDPSNKLLGLVTDGDVRRGILNGTSLEEPVSRIMTRSPRTAAPSLGPDQILEIMKRHRVHQIPVVDEAGRVLGLEVLDEVLSPQALPNPVILLAGGRGTRLAPLTESVPKPLLEVGGRPILEQIVARLRDHGFRSFYFAVNYKAEMIVDHFGKGEAMGVEINYLHEDAPLGTAGALGLLPSPPKHDFLVMNADLMTAVHPGRLLDFHFRTEGEATMCIRGHEETVPYGVVAREGDRFLSVEEKPIHSFFVNAGIYALSPSVLDIVEPGRPLNMTDLFSKLVAEGRVASVYPLREYWLDIGQPPELARAQAEWQEVYSS